MSSIIIPAFAKKYLAGHDRILYTTAMNTLPTPQDLEIMAVRAGISMTEACKRANVSPAVFHRWKRGKNPGLEHIRAVIAALHSAIAESK